MPQRRGYDREYASKKRLQELYGDNNVVKVAVSQKAPDFICFKRLLSVGSEPIFKIENVEIKSTIQKKYYPQKHDIKQFHMFKKWQESNKTPIFYHIWTKQNNKWTRESLSIQHYEEKYIKEKK